MGTLLKTSQVCTCEAVGVEWLLVYTNGSVNINSFDPLTLNLELPQMSANDLKLEAAQVSVTCTLYTCVIRGAGLGHW